MKVDIVTAFIVVAFSVFTLFRAFHFLHGPRIKSAENPDQCHCICIGIILAAASTFVIYSFVILHHWLGIQSPTMQAAMATGSDMMNGLLPFLFLACLQSLPKKD